MWKACSEVGLQEHAKVGPSEDITKAARDLIKLFGKDGCYEGDNWRYQLNGNGVQISLKDGTRVLENGQFNFCVPYEKVADLEKIPKEVERVKAQIAQKMSTVKQAQRTQTGDLAL